MSNDQYPRHMYKNLHQPKYAHDKKALDAMMADGWTDVRANAGHQEYPKGLWNEAGDGVTVGNYNKDGIVDLDMAKSEEARYARQGYTPKFVAPAAEVPANTSAAPVGGSRMDQMEADMQSLKSAMADLIQAVQNSNARGRKSREPEI